MSYYLPAGLYTIGDPCYYFSDRHGDLWDEFLMINNFPGDGYLDKNEEYPVVVFDTLYGDGCYSDNDGNEYGVDSGCIGIIPHTEGEKVPHSHLEVYFSSRFLCSEKKGILTFGDVVINTGDENESENEDGETYDEY